MGLGKREEEGEGREGEAQKDENIEWVIGEGGVKNKEWKGRGESTESIKSAVSTMNCPESLEGDRERGEE